jgi:hypothetical protein
VPPVAPGTFSRVKLAGTGGRTSWKPLKIVMLPYPTTVPALLMPSAWVNVGFTGSMIS